ncbi:MAG: hypothetical protein WCF20_07805 [Methylovirgula sp.]
MSKAHPQDGPTFSAAPPKRRRPITDQELADWQARKAAEEEQMIRDAATSRKFWQTVNKEGIIAGFNYLRLKRGLPPFK